MQFDSVKTKTTDYDQLSEYDFSYPQELVGTGPQKPSRVLLNQSGNNKEIDIPSCLDLFQSGDVLVVNNTKVLPRKLTGRIQSSENTFEVLFLKQLSDLKWEVLFPAKKLKADQAVELMDGVQFKLLERGLPQTVELSTAIDDTYFSEHGSLALPPYIEKARAQQSLQIQTEDMDWYQTEWAKETGSCAAPTASLHFTQDDLATLKRNGVQVCELTLHVGLGTFLPVHSDTLSDHKMHEEAVEISAKTLKTIESAQGRVFALGTTVARSLEAWKRGHFETLPEGGVAGATDLFIKPGFEYQVVDVLMTNFHQPKSTLLALVGAFAGLENVKSTYAWAMERKFRLFSYGDLSIWMR